MNQTAEDLHIDPVDEDEISFIEIANTLLRRWRLVLLLPLLFAVVTGLRTLAQKRLYAASATFFPQAVQERGGGGAAALAEQFGVSLGGEQPTQTPQFYVDLLKSPVLLRAVVESHYTVVENGVKKQVTLVDLLTPKERKGSGPLWGKAASVLRKRISASISRQTGVIRLSVSAPQPALAEQVAERVLGLLNSFILGMRQSRALDESRFITARLQEAQLQLKIAEDRLENFETQNRQYQGAPKLLFIHGRLERQVLMRQDVYTSLLRWQEEARIDGMRDTPLITVIDHAAGTAEPQGRGTVSRTMFALMMGLAVSIVLALLSESYQRGRTAEDPRWFEFHRLIHQVWSDIRHPRRWLRRGERAPVIGHD